MSNSLKRPYTALSPLALAFAIAAILHWQLPHVARRREAPDHPCHGKQHGSHVFTEFWSQDEISDLLALVRATGFRSTTASYPLPRYEHVGEVEPLAEGPGGGCSSSILNPNKERTHCVYPERIDVAAHQLVSGGIDARRESYATTVSRLIVQQHYFYAEGSADSVNTGGSGGQKEDRVEAVPAVANLFRSPHYLREARKLCQWPGDDGDGDAAVGDRNDIVLHPMSWP